MYTFDSRVRYSETDENGYLTPHGILNYLQDCSTFQSEDIGVGVAWLKARSRAWLLSGWHIVTDRVPHLGERITIGTVACGFKGIYGDRHFWISDADGAFCVRADSLWFLYDTEKGLPARPAEEEIAPYLRSLEQPELSLEKVQRKLSVPWPLEAMEQVTVQRQHLDSNHHVNNAQYVSIALAACGRGIPQSFQVEYRKAAKLGDVMFIRRGETENGRQAVVLSDAALNPYAILHMSKEDAQH